MTILTRLSEAALYIEGVRVLSDHERRLAAAELLVDRESIKELVVASCIALLRATDTSDGTFTDADDGCTYWSCCFRRLNYSKQDLAHEESCWTHGLRAAHVKFGDTP